MLQRMRKPSNLEWSSEPLLGFKVPNLHRGGSYVCCLLVTSVGTTKPAGAPFADIIGKIAFASWLDTGEGVENPTGDAEIFAIEPDSAGLIRRTHIGEPSE